MRLAVESLEDRVTPTTFTVTNTNDAGSGSLRWAITHANSTPGADTIAFDIPGDGVHTIALASALPAITDRVTIAGHTQPGFMGTPLIELNGAAAWSEDGPAWSGLVLRAGASRSVVRGLVVNWFEGNGLVIQADNCRIVGNYIGIAADGSTAGINLRSGVVINHAASGNVIGGLTPGARNVISGNARGVLLSGAGTSWNVVEGNYIGTDASGTAIIGNSGEGVLIYTGASCNIVGGTAAGARNVISGNSFDGVLIDSGRTPGNLVQGNYIGTDVTGTVDLGNVMEGVVIFAGSTGNVIGGTTPAARNIISGNDTSGVLLIGNGTSGNVVEGNYIGTDASGTANLGNSDSGVIISEGASGNILGGTTPGARNIISGNGGSGVEFYGLGTRGNLVQGNFMGTDVTGAEAIGNSRSGVLFRVTFGGAESNIIGGRAPGARNIISGNLASGVEITGTGTTGNRIQGNRIGLAATGSTAIPNALDGVRITDASGNIVGGTQPGTGNVIANNAGNGVTVVSGSRNSILGNRIPHNGALGIDLGNDGVTPNDLGDKDGGANDQLNFPILSRAHQFTRVHAIHPGSPGFFIDWFLRVQGSINTETNKTLRIEFFSSPAADPSGNGEGRRFIGATTMATGNANIASFNVVLPLSDPIDGQVITATATDELGNTSEFSAATPVSV